MNYKDFDIFLITKDNWKSQDEVFYGYKTLDDNGLWLKVFWEDSCLLIKGSYIQPYISIYQSDDYWAISNNFYCLEQHLISKNIKLTKNKAFEEWDKDSFRFCIQASPTETLYNEIKFNDNFSYLKILDGNLEIINLEIDCFTKPLEDSKEDLLNWYKKYYDYLHTLPEGTVSAQLSGGFDSRILLPLYEDINGVSINAQWNKEDDDSYRDGLAARLYIAKKYPHLFDNLLSKEDKTWVANNDKAKQENAKLITQFITYGSYPIKGELDLSNMMPCKSTSGKISLAGMSLELHKNNLANSVQEIETTTRRYFVNRYLIRYYRSKQRVVCPFQDKELLKIKGCRDLTFVYILLGLFNINDEKLPYYTYLNSKPVLKFVSNEEIEEALSLLK